MLRMLKKLVLIMLEMLTMLEKIEKENWFDFDTMIATPDMMPLLR